MKIILTAKFEREYKKLSNVLKDKAKAAIEIFSKNPADARLRVHKLNGRFSNYRAFIVAYDCRIIFRYGREGEVFLITIGKHDVYR